MGREGEFNVLRPEKLALCFSHTIEKPSALISENAASSDARRKTFCSAPRDSEGKGDNKGPRKKREGCRGKHGAIRVTCIAEVSTPSVLPTQAVSASAGWSRADRGGLLPPALPRHPAVGEPSPAGEEAPRGRGCRAGKEEGETAQLKEGEVRPTEDIYFPPWWLCISCFILFAMVVFAALDRMSPQLASSFCSSHLCPLSHQALLSWCHCDVRHCSRSLPITTLLGATVTSRTPAQVPSHHHSSCRHLVLFPSSTAEMLCPHLQSPALRLTLTPGMSTGRGSVGRRRRLPFAAYCACPLLGSSALWSEISLLTQGDRLVRQEAAWVGACHSKHSFSPTQINGHTV